MTGRAPRRLAPFRRWRVGVHPSDDDGKSVGRRRIAHMPDCFFGSGTGAMIERGHHDTPARHHRHGAQQRHGIEPT